MATSLAAIGIIAAVGSVSYGLHGELKPGAAALIGVPAALGAVAGTTLQQRLDNRTLSLAFAALVLGVGVKLLIWWAPSRSRSRSASRAGSSPDSSGSAASSSSCRR